jgi:CubicO group peptidase (beta-lactamase class C family)
MSQHSLRLNAQVMAELLAAARVPGLALAVVRDGRVAETLEAGRACVNSKRPVTTETVFQAASLSKPVFAYLVLQLVREGLLDLDIPLTHYSRELWIDYDEHLDQVTARHVLGHTTGWPNWRPKGQLLVRDALPGERFTYSGEGYVYLQRVVEYLAGRSLEQLARERLFESAQMGSSTFDPAAVDDQRMAGAHDQECRPIEQHIGTRPSAASSLHCTATDFARFMVALLTTGADLLTEMIRPHVTVKEDLAWGLGWGLETSSTGRGFWHWGDNPGYKSFAVAVRETSSGVVVMTNADSGRRLCATVVRRIIGPKHPALSWLANRYGD